MKCSLLFVTFLLPLTLWTEEPAPPETSINAGFNLTRGNQDTVLFELGGETLRSWGEQSLKVAASYAYGQTEAEEKDITTRDTSTASLRYETKLKDPWFGYAEAEALQDEVASIDYRLTIGPGFGAKVIQNDSLEVSMDVGAAWVAEEIDGESSGSAAGKLGQSLKWVISDNASLSQSVNVLRKFNSERDHIVNARVTLQSILTGNLSLRLDLQNRYESEPAEGKDSNNLSFTAGLALKL